MCGISANKTDNIAKVQDTLSIAFADSAAALYLTKKFQNRPVSQPFSQDQIYESYGSYCREFLSKGGYLLESNDHDCVAIVVPPQEAPVSATRTLDPEFNRQFIEPTEGLKRQLGLGSKLKYYYLFMIGKNLQQPQIKGSTRAVLEYLKRHADQKNAAVVLEAINEKAKKVYEYFGFIDYGELYYGQNEVDSSGEPNEKGDGFKANFMVYHKLGKLPMESL